MRESGMELTGTELDPDWFVFGGGLYESSSLENRFAILTKEREDRYDGEWYEEYLAGLRIRRARIEKGRGFFDGSEDEEKRVLSSLPDPIKRFHYRYRAAELMWKCAELLPDNDELKARALWTGGTYLKKRDPKAADRFYKELVNTCRKTRAGEAADKLRWFPKEFPEE